MSLNPTKISQELKGQPVVSPPLIFSWRPTPKINVIPAINYPDLLSAGSALIKGGVNVIPVDKRKKPLVAWKPYQKRRTTIPELEKWCKSRAVCGLAMIGGEISRGLVILDSDVFGFFEKLIEKVKQNREVRELAYILPIQQTGSGNYQMAFRCGLSLRNDKLAWVPADNLQKKETAIEIKAEGGYAVVAPSHCPQAEKHGIKHKQAYKVIQGDFANIPTITDRQASILLDSARSLDEMPPTEKEMRAAPLPPHRNGDGVDGGVIGAFNQLFDIRTILERNGYERRGNRYLAPDSTTGMPGVHIFEDTGRCYSHHANDPLNDGHSHDAFDVFRILEHGGDLKTAVRAAAETLGIERTPPQVGPDPDQDYDRQEREAIQAENPLPRIIEGILELENFVALPLPERKKYLDPWLLESSINMIYGPRGVGKTMFGFSILEAVARGAAFGPWGAGESVNVLYLDGELVMADFQERANYFKKDSYLSKFYVYSTHHLSLLGLRNANLGDKTWQKEMTDVLKYLQVKLWVIDNIASLTSGIDENLKHEWDPINQWFLKLRFAGISTIFQHHTGKEKLQRGTSGREDNIDISILLDYPKGYFKEDGCKFVAIFEKARIRQRDLTLIADTEFSLETDENNSHVWTYANLRISNKKAVLELRDKGQSQKKIAETLDLSEGYVSKIISKAEKDGHITAGGKLTQSGYVLICGA
jgi:putative DNA primase/helicase